VFDGEGGAHLRAEKKTTATAARVEEAELDGEGRQKALAVLLLQFLASACSTEAERGGAFRVQYLAGGAGDVERERAGISEGVWEVAGSGVRPFV
jgi:hypothetical protein